MRDVVRAYRVGRHNRIVAFAVWVQSWQPGDQRRSYAVGDEVSWQVSYALDADWAWFDRVFGVAIARDVTHVLESCSRPAFSVSGRITSARSLTVTYSDGASGGFALPASGKVAPIQVIPQALPDRDSATSVSGYLVDLDVYLET